MRNRVVPMIHVPDVRATADWYEKIGFVIVDTYGNDSDGLSFAILSFGDTKVMFNEGGKPSSNRRREVDLYIYTDNVDDLYLRLKDQVEVIEAPNDRFYGMREFIVRDLNRFWLTFAEESVFAKLMRGVRERDVQLVRNTLGNGDIRSETLIAVLAAAAEDHGNGEIVKILQEAGATKAPEVDPKILQSYVGKYKMGDFEVNVTFENDKLFAAPGRQEPLSLMALNETTFTPIALDNFGTIAFAKEADKTIGCQLNQGAQSLQLKRVTS